MTTDKLPQWNGEDRLRTLKHKGLNLLYCDFSECDLAVGRQLLVALVQRLNGEEDASVRLLINTKNAPHESSQALEWKRHLPVFDAKLKKSAIVGLGPLHRIALAGVRMYAKLMGHEKSITQAQVFEGQDSAIEYLASDK